MVNNSQLENPELSIPVNNSTEMKEVLVEYVGTKLQPENNEVTLEMVINTMSEEFPEIVLAIAEENWIRGYKQGLDDVDAGMEAMTKNGKKESHRSCEKEE
jgi:hypothetical protein